MAVMNYCIRHGVVEATHRCTRDGFVETENQIRYRKNKQHGTRTAYWRKLRQQALERDNYQCQLNAARRCTKVASTVHPDPALRGNHRVAGLEHCKSACKLCHGVEDGRRTPRR
jgi:hypothetical protein